MFNIIPKCILVSTSLSPVLLTMAVQEYEREPRCLNWTIGILLALTLLLVVLCWLLMVYARSNLQIRDVNILSIERKDHEVLTFLFIYLLPLVRSGSANLLESWMTTTFVGIIIIYALAQADAYHFNPLMRLVFQQRFYAVNTSEGQSDLVISKKRLHSAEKRIQAVEIAPNVFLVKE